MTMHRQTLDCPLCGTWLAAFDGLGTVDDGFLRQYREAKAGHRPHCPALQSAGSPPARTGRRVAERAG